MKKSQVKKESRSSFFKFYVTPTEEKRIVAWAEASKLPISEYLRLVVLQGFELSMSIKGQEQVIKPDSISVEVRGGRPAEEGPIKRVADGQL